MHILPAMPPRRLAKRERRIKTIHVKVTSEEKKLIERRASAVGMKTGTWLRGLGLEKGRKQ